jgi:hypothetical protein
VNQPTTPNTDIPAPLKMTSQRLEILALSQCFVASKPMPTYLFKSAVFLSTAPISIALTSFNNLSAFPISSLHLLHSLKNKESQFIPKYILPFLQGEISDDISPHSLPMWLVSVAALLRRSSPSPHLLLRLLSHVPALPSSDQS